MFKTKGRMYIECVQVNGICIKMSSSNALHWTKKLAFENLTT